MSNFAGKTPFAAINLIMPVLMILGTVDFMSGTGGTALIAFPHALVFQSAAIMILPMIWALDALDKACAYVLETMGD